MDSRLLLATRALNDFHDQVKDITAFSAFQTAELRNAPKILLAKAKEGEDLFFIWPIVLSRSLALHRGDPRSGNSSKRFIHIVTTFPLCLLPFNRPT
jgi:hypothetical protein